MSGLSAKQTAKNARSRRVLQKREPQLVENEKSGLFLKGPTVNEVVKKALTDLYVMKKPQAKIFTKQNSTRPFEDASTLEFLTRANDTSTFVFGSHTKKRPCSLIFGRMFDFSLLDMIEVQIDPSTFKTMTDLAPLVGKSARAGGKPMFVFVGEEFEQREDLALFKNMILDMYRGAVFDHINLNALDRVIVCTAATDSSELSAHKFVYLRQYYVNKVPVQGSRLPRVELEEIGPRLDFTLNRTKSADAEVRKLAMKVPYAVKPTKQKNVEEGQLGDKLGRVHMKKQDLETMALAGLKGLGKRNNPNAKRKADVLEEGGDGGDGGGEGPVPLDPMTGKPMPRERAGRPILKKKRTPANNAYGNVVFSEK